MSWIWLAGLALALGLALAGLCVRRAELRRMARTVDERDRARERGSHRARLQYPHVDLTHCIGCGVCVAACPEEGVLDIVHGQALVVHGARCVGHGACARECPVGAIAVTLGDLGERRDIPALTDGFEASGIEGVFLAGEVTGYALIRTAISHGTAVAREVAQRTQQRNGSHRDAPAYDLAIVGAGPAGIACSLEAKARGLSFVTLEQEELGGTVAKYPRRKLVMTQPVELPLHGELDRTSYSKEELMELWWAIAGQNELPIYTGWEFKGLERLENGAFRVHNGSSHVDARHVCLALGRRGTPRKLGVPGEELPKVAYSLIDAQSYRGRRILIVGGGDSAIEAAVGLAEQPGNRVTLSYRRKGFFRIKARNEARLLQSVEAGALEVLYESRVVAIQPDAVDLECGPEEASRAMRLPNDDVFVLAGGIPPFQLLEQSGVSFDPADRKDPEPLAERAGGLVISLATAFLLAIAALLWSLRFQDYYGADAVGRSGHPLHDWLRPSRGVGLALGLASVGLITANLAYLVRRSPRFSLALGSLQGWMTAHVVTGILALILAFLHAGLAPLNTVGGHALAALGVLVVTGAIGRYFYSFVPRAANGQELALDEVKTSLAELSAGWEQTHREFGARVRDEVQRLVESGHWKGSFVRRLVALLRSQRTVRRGLARLRDEGRREGVAPDQLAEVLGLARRAHRTALMAAHYEDLRGLLASWRYLHRWFALLMVLLVVAHVVTALRFGELLGGGS